MLGLLISISTQPGIVAQNSPVKLGTNASSVKPVAPSRKGLRGSPPLELGVPRFLATPQQIGTTADIAGITMIGGTGVTETVGAIMSRQRLRAAASRADVPAISAQAPERHLPRPPDDISPAGAASQWPPADENAPARQATTRLSPQVLSTAFDGVTRAGADASTSADDEYSQDAVLDGGDTLLITRPVPLLAGGAEDKPGVFSVTIPASATPGSRFIIAAADRSASPTGVVAESLDGTKNHKKVGLTINP